MHEKVNGLWIGGQLGPIERLTIKSFQKHGHEFILWHYDPITKAPAGTIFADANELVPRDKVFRYDPLAGHMKTNVPPVCKPGGKGSYAGFSDIFRYKLLHDIGGWYVDMDVTCLKPFDFDTEYVFRDHPRLPLVGNMMRCPQGSEAMRQSYEEALSEVHSDNDDWEKPIRILCKWVLHYGLHEYIRRDISNPDMIEKTHFLFTEPGSVAPDHWYFIHWMNAMGPKKHAVTSMLHKLLLEYDLLQDDQILFA